jgi:hypothetical protein
MTDEDDGSREDCLFFDYDARAFSNFRRSPGVLCITPGRVTFTPRRWRSMLPLNPMPAFEHRTDPVVVISAALSPIGCWLVLLDPAAPGTRAVPMYSYANLTVLLEALRRADFQVEHYSTNVSVARVIITESDLELFRRSNQDRVTVLDGINGAQDGEDGYAIRRHSPVDQWLGTPVKTEWPIEAQCGDAAFVVRVELAASPTGWGKWIGWLGLASLWRSRTRDQRWEVRVRPKSQDPVGLPALREECSSWEAAWDRANAIAGQIRRCELPRLGLLRE